MTKDKVRWTQAHLDALNQAFPEVVNQPDVNKLLIGSGMRSVVLWVGQQITHQEKRLASS